jgi:hypothetical protein
MKQAHEINKTHNRLTLITNNPIRTEYENGEYHIYAQHADAQRIQNAAQCMNNFISIKPITETISLIKVLA